MVSSGDSQALFQVVKQLEQWSGCPFSHYKEGTLRRRIERRMMITKQPDFSSYLRYLSKNVQEYRLLLDSLTLKVSEFFRDREVFEMVKEVVFPAVVGRDDVGGMPAIRIWSTACAFGEEPYSLAILLLQFLEDHAFGVENCTILGTDIDPMAIEKARRGIYPKERLGWVYDQFRDFFWEHPHLKSGEVQLVPKVRNMVDFFCFDVSSTRFHGPPQAVFAEYDLIFVRNVMIYYDEEVKDVVISKIYGCLKNGGFLVLGRSEVLPDGWKERFLPVSRTLKIYRKPE